MTPFLALPGEIRNRIYEFALISSYPIWLGLSPDDPNKTQTLGLVRLAPALLATNSQINDEATFILYSRNSFQPCGDLPYSTILAFLNLIGRQAKYLEDVTLPFPRTPQCRYMTTFLTPTAAEYTAYLRQNAEEEKENFQVKFSLDAADPKTALVCRILGGIRRLNLTVAFSVHEMVGMREQDVVNKEWAQNVMRRLLWPEPGMRRTARQRLVIAQDDDDPF